jgi:hypothetical protein
MEHFQATFFNICSTREAEAFTIRNIATEIKIIPSLALSAFEYHDI